MKIIAGNWKMHKTTGEALALVEAIHEAELRVPPAHELWVFPPFPSLSRVAAWVHDRGSRIAVGAQNLHPGREGAFTGEVSARMLVDAGAKAVLIGHSERRHIFGETDADVAAKVESALEAGLRPLVCIGETLEEREGERTEQVLARQIERGLGSLGVEDVERLRLAYEPVWAIGTGKTATVEQVASAHAHVRELLADRWGGPGRECPILYGGSVKPENAAELLNTEAVAGALVGGASLEAAAFLGIATATG